MDIEYCWAIYRDGQKVAAGSAFSEVVRNQEANHYACVYGQDGPVRMRRWQRRAK